MTTLHHIAIGAHNVEVIADFYANAFGLSIVERYHNEDGSLRSIWLGTGSTLLMIEHTEDTGHVGDGISPGPFLLAFSITPEARHDAEMRLAGMGSPMISRTSFTSYHRDPNGNRIALSTWPVPSPPSEVSS